MRDTRKLRLRLLARLNIIRRSSLRFSNTPCKKGKGRNMNSVIAAVVWLLPLLIYLAAFRDTSSMRIVWSIVMLLFTWVGLLVRFIYGLVAANTDARLP